MRISDWSSDVCSSDLRPGHELKAEAIVDHGEAARCEREPLPIGAGDVFAAPSLGECPAGLRGELVRQRVKLASAQRLDELAREDDALDVPFGVPLVDQLLTAPNHGAAKFHPGAPPPNPKADR